MANIKDYPLSKLADFLQFAYEKELYERWITLYPLMETGFLKYISFKEYKQKIKQKALSKQRNRNLSDKQIMQHGMEIIEMYERNQQKAGDKSGDI